MGQSQHSTHSTSAATYAKILGCSGDLSVDPDFFSSFWRSILSNAEVPITVVLGETFPFSDLIPSASCLARSLATCTMHNILALGSLILLLCVEALMSSMTDLI